MTGGERERYNRLQYVSEEPGRRREITGRKTIPLSCQTLKKVVEFCEYHHNLDIRRRNGEDPAALA